MKWSERGIERWSEGWKEEVRKEVTQGATFCKDLHAGGSVGSKSKLRFDVSKNSHNLLTHFPIDPNCPICNSCKRNRAHCRSKVHGEPDELPEPKEFADAVTTDFKILNEDDESRNADRVALVIMDRFTC